MDGALRQLAVGGARAGGGPDRRRRSIVRGVAAGIAVATLSGACTGSDTQDPPEKPSEEPPATRTTGSLATDVDADRWVDVAAEAGPSVVSIAVVGQQGTGEGSGVVIDDDGHVLTNNHVIAGAAAGAQVQVALTDARVFAAELVGADPATDLAVLRMTDAPAELAPLTFGDSEAVAVGQPVMALGNPLGLSHTVTVGIVSALDRPVTTQSSGTSTAEPVTPVVTNAIQTDAAVNPGNSGGALVDSDGRLVGINSSIATLGASAGGQGGSIGLGFAIPSSQAQWVAEELIRSGAIEHAYLGVTPEDVVIEMDGVRREAAGITSVVPDTPAAEGGLRPGEAIVEVEGEVVASAQSLIAQIREREPGTRVELTVVDSGGSPRAVTVEFGTRPEA
jgi:putative serine protease PepD